MSRILALAVAGCTGGFATEELGGSGRDDDTADTGDDLEDTADTGLPCRAPALPIAAPSMTQYDVSFPYPGGCASQGWPSLGWLPAGAVVSLEQTDCDVPGTGRGGLSQLRTADGKTVLLEARDPARLGILGFALPRVPTIEGAEGIFAIYSDPTYSYYSGGHTVDIHAA